jgi:hypothetical protein
MTTLNYLNTILPLVLDLDENIIKSDEKRHRTIIDFNNPVTGSLERVVFEHPNGNGMIEQVLYVPTYHDFSIFFKEEYIMEDLNDLYEFILIDEE